VEGHAGKDSARGAPHSQLPAVASDDLERFHLCRPRGRLFFVRPRRRVRVSRRCRGSPCACRRLCASPPRQVHSDPSWSRHCRIVLDLLAPKSGRRNCDDRPSDGGLPGPRYEATSRATESDVPSAGRVSGGQACSRRRKRARRRRKQRPRTTSDAR
jgi:hypothetical protein